MALLRKIFDRLSDPVFYVKRWRGLVRSLKPRAGEPSETNFTLESLPNRPKAVLIIAHPDDELFASGLICELAARKGQTTVLCLTRGEGGVAGSWKREELGDAREEEMRRSCAHLGITDIRFLGYVDPYTETERVYAPKVSITDLAALLEKHLLSIRPDIVITHGSNGEYWHPAHLMLNQALNKAWPKCKTEDTVMATLNAWQSDHPLPQFLNLDDPANLTVDASRHHAKRLAALLCHESQLQWFTEFTRCTPDEFIEKTAKENYLVKYANRLELALLFLLEGSVAECNLLERILY